VAALPGEVVTAKSNMQMMAVLCAEEGTVFLFVDLHYPCLLHYFEGPCIRIELSCQSALIREIERLPYNRAALVVGSTNLRRANWVNRYATELKVPLALMREKERETKEGDDIAFRSVSGGVVGDIRGKHVLIYDDIIRSGKTIISAANCYIDAGATGVDVCTSHLACFSDDHIQAIIESRIGVVIATNSHPATRNPLVVGSPKFRIVNIAELFNQCLYELLPSADHLRGVSF
jgi:ribose-phosphate pyrophosphokinase